MTNASVVISEEHYNELRRRAETPDWDRQRERRRFWHDCVVAVLNCTSGTSSPSHVIADNKLAEYDKRFPIEK